jgi:hypothetical protein
MDCRPGSVCTPQVHCSGRLGERAWRATRWRSLPRALAGLNPQDPDGVEPCQRPPPHASASPDVLRGEGSLKLFMQIAVLRLAEAFETAGTPRVPQIQLGGNAFSTLIGLMNALKAKELGKASR